MDSWLHPDLSAPKNESESVARPRHHAPKASYDNSTSLYKALKEAHAHLDEEVAKWHDVQVRRKLRHSFLFFGLP